MWNAVLFTTTTTKLNPRPLGLAMDSHQINRGWPYVFLLCYPIQLILFNYFYQCYFRFSSISFHSLNLNQITFSLIHWLLSFAHDQTISSNSFFFFSTIGAILIFKQISSFCTSSFLIISRYTHFTNMLPFNLTLQELVIENEEINIIACLNISKETFS